MAPAFGLTTCGKCDKWAYYYGPEGHNGSGMCGRHAPKPRVKLPRDADAEQTIIDDHNRTVHVRCPTALIPTRKLKLQTVLFTLRVLSSRLAPQAAARANRADGEKGSLTCTKMHMVRKVSKVPGHQNVFPNYKHAGRVDGWGMADLSPKSIGPIHLYDGVHGGETSTRYAKSLENFHQGSKWFEGRTEEEFKAMQKYMFADSEPRRHNPHATGASPLVRIPIKCFVWTDAEGVDHHLSYVESRQFYCTFYMRAVLNMSELPPVVF
jgi:hypothetical protein